MLKISNGFKLPSKNPHNFYFFPRFLICTSTAPKAAIVIPIPSLKVIVSPRKYQAKMATFHAAQQNQFHFTETLFIFTSWKHSPNTEQPFLLKLL